METFCILDFINLPDRGTWVIAAGREVAALAEVIRAQYQEAYQCGRKIADFIGDKYQYTLSEEEILYLSIHIARIVSVSRKPRA